MTSNNALLTPEDSQKKKLGERIDKDYFFIPVIYYRAHESSDIDESWYSLRYATKAYKDSLISYASKVEPDLTLWEAMRRDFKQDFRYSDGFMIENIQAYDTAPTKTGIALSRLLILVSAYNKFYLRGLESVGLHVSWRYEGEFLFNPVPKILRKSIGESEVL